MMPEEISTTTERVDLQGVWAVDFGKDLKSGNKHVIKEMSGHTGDSIVELEVLSSRSKLWLAN